MYAPQIPREIGGTGPSHGPSIPTHPGPSVDDAALKKLFSHPRMIELLIRRHVPQWDGKIDYSTLERLPAELIDERLRRRYPDMMWGREGDVTFEGIRQRPIGGGDDDGNCGD